MYLALTMFVSETWTDIIFLLLLYIRFALNLSLYD
jgi:hypothetical protein